MSDTPKLADEVKKLLDNGAYVVLYRNGLGSYTAVALRNELTGEVQNVINMTDDMGPHITDDFEPSQALYRLAEKSLGNIV